MARRKVKVRRPPPGVLGARAGDAPGDAWRRSVLELMRRSREGAGNFQTGALGIEELEPTLERLQVLGVRAAVALVELSDSLGDRARAVRRLVQVATIDDDGLCFEYGLAQGRDRVAVVVMDVDAREAMRRVRRLSMLYTAVTPEAEPRDRGAPAPFMAGVATASSDTSPTMVVEAAIGALIRAESWGASPIVCVELGGPQMPTWPVVAPAGEGAVAIAANQGRYRLPASA